MRWKLLHHLEVRAAEAGQLRRRHHREAVDRHQDVAAVRIVLEVDELVDVVALRDAAIAVDVLVVDARQQHARMEVQVAPDPAVGVGDAAAAAAAPAC